jgi:hypothetical protein
LSNINKEEKWLLTTWENLGWRSCENARKTKAEIGQFIAAQRFALPAGGWDAVMPL